MVAVEAGPAGSAYLRDISEGQSAETTGGRESGSQKILEEKVKSAKKVSNET